MDKREIAAAFRERLQVLLGDERGGIGGFPARHRHRPLGAQPVPRPRRSTACRGPRPCAASPRRAASPPTGSSASRTRPEGRQEVTPSVQIESAETPGGGSPIDQWRREAAGMKLRYVPSNLPDMLGLAEDEPAAARPAPASRRTSSAASVLGDMDVEIAMPVQTLRDLSQGGGLWRGTAPRPAPPPARPHGRHLRRGLPDAAPAPLRRPPELRRALHRLRPHPRRALPRRGLPRRHLHRPGRRPQPALRQSRPPGRSSAPSASRTCSTSWRTRQGRGDTSSATGHDAFVVGMSEFPG